IFSLQHEISLTKEQLLLAEDVADYYMVALPLVIASFLPKVPKKAWKPLAQKTNQPKNETCFQPHVDIQHAAHTFFTSNNQHFLLKYSSLHQKYSFYSEIFKNALETKQQVLIVVPEIIHIETLRGIAKDNKHVAVMVAGLGKNEYLERWNNIQQGKTQIIIGTRIALFAPFKNLSTIVVDNEESQNHKQWDMNPRMHTREAAMMLGRIHECKLLATTHMPSVESLNQILEKKTLLLHLPPAESAYKINLVDLGAERKKKNSSLISEALGESLEKNLMEHHKSLLLLNKKGSAGMLVCEDCGHVSSCDTCHRPLALSQDWMNCPSCGKKTLPVLVCPSCQSVNLRERGAGIEKIVQILKKTYPHAKVSLIKAGRKQSQSVQNDDIIVATDAVIFQYHWQDVATVATLFADGELLRGNFRSMELVLQYLGRVALKAENESNVFQELMIQTYQPDNIAYRSLLRADTKEFYKNEILYRKKLGYPPFSSFIKAIYQHKDQNIGAASYQNTIERAANTLKNPIEIIDRGMLEKTRNGRHRWIFTLKIPKNLPAHRREIRSIFPDNWIIDVDPIDFE
ncbi:MAG TPA: primosomal protein N', partial [Patescibacteria group bacterium]|nr:primosomal protein N' [Patescibacteria group bacterium]